MPKRRFASSILLLNRGDSWTGLDLEYGHVNPASTYVSALGATRDAILQSLGAGIEPPKPPVRWIYPAMYRLAIKNGRPGKVNDANNSVASHLAVPVLFAFENDEWTARTHVAYAVRAPVVLATV